MTVREVVICAEHGGFGLSAAGQRAYLARKGKEAFFFRNTRDANGRVQFDGKEVAEDPDSEFVTYTYTSSDASEDSYFSDRDIPRDDPDLVAVVDELGRAADGKYCTLEVVEIPADVEWVIEEYDGLEWVAEKHLTWNTPRPRAQTGRPA